MQSIKARGCLRNQLCCSQRASGLVLIAQRLNVSTVCLLTWLVLEEFALISNLMKRFYCDVTVYPFQADLKGYLSQRIWYDFTQYSFRCSHCFFNHFIQLHWQLPEWCLFRESCNTMCSASNVFLAVRALKQWESFAGWNSWASFPDSEDLIILPNCSILLAAVSRIGLILLKDFI